MCSSALRVVCVVVEAVKGTAFDAVLHSALAYSLEHRCNVEVTFNGQKYIVHYSAIVTCFKEAVGGHLPMQQDVAS